MHRLFFLTIALATMIALGWGQEVPTTGRDLLQLTLDERPDQITAWLGTAARVDDSLSNYFSWFFKNGVRDEHESSYIFCFSKSEGRLISVTRNFDPEEPVDHFFPAGGSTVHHWPSAEAPHFSVRLRNLSDDRVLLAMGSAKAGEPAAQIILMRRSALPFFFPWLN